MHKIAMNEHLLHKFMFICAKSANAQRCLNDYAHASGYIRSNIMAIMEFCHQIYIEYKCVKVIIYLNCLIFFCVWKIPNTFWRNIILESSKIT